MELLNKRDMRIAVLITVFNRIEKTLICLESLFKATLPMNCEFSYKVFLTDDGSTDDTQLKIKEIYSRGEVEVLNGDGSLYWNGGMNNSWRKAIQEGGFDGYLWLNNDSVLYTNTWIEIVAADEYSRKNYRQGGIYIGSTKDVNTKEFSYGGFLFTNKWTLKDKFLHPNGEFQNCHAGHGNITYVSNDVVEREGILCDKYLHGVGDHDYTYLAYKHGSPVLVMREYVGECVNDHSDSEINFQGMSLKDRFAYSKSPLGYNLPNTLLFQRRCFPYRFPLVWCLSYFRLLFPGFYYRFYKFLRRG